MKAVVGLILSILWFLPAFSSPSATETQSFCIECWNQAQSTNRNFQDAHQEIHDQLNCGPVLETGKASFYGAKGGGTTAYEENVDPSAFTAAHPSQPHNSLLLVHNLVNDKKVLVRVNDRGPFIKDRIIDLTPAAARKIGLTRRQGIAKNVELRVCNPAL